MRPRLVSTPRPLGISLSRFTSLATMAAAMALAGPISSQGAPVSWDGSGDNLLWTTPLNWSNDAVPLAGDDLTFGTGAPGLVLLNGNQTANSLSFTQNFTLGAFGVASTLTNVTGTISVSSGTFGTINATLAGSNGLTLNGGGSLYLTNPFNSFTGAVTVDGAGTSLVINTTLPPSPSTRGDAYVLGGPGAKAVNLTNGGELKIIGGTYNPDGSTKNIVLGAGGGAINVTAGYQQYSLDDGGQLAGAGGLTKNGAGRLSIGGANDYLIGSAGNNHTLNGGFLDFSRVATPTGGTYARFMAFNSASSVTINGGVFVPNSSTVGFIDNNITLKGSGVLGMQSANHEYGVRTGTATTLTLNDGVILARDAFGTQTARNFFVNSQLLGDGSIDVMASTGAFGIGGGGRLVLQRSDAGSTFNGTFVLRDAAYLETNPRYGANVNFGNILGAASVEMAGFNTGLDLRDSGTNAGQTGQTLNYTGNNLLISDTQAGSLPRLAVTQGAAGATNNTIHLGQLSIGNQRLQVTSSSPSNYGARFTSTVLTGNASLDLVSAPLQLDGTISAPAGSITKLGNSALTLTGAVSVANIEARHGNVILNGANGSVPTGAITVNGVANANNASLSQGALLLDNTIAGSTNADRLGNAVPIKLLGNALLRLTSENGVAVSETTGIVSTLGNPTFDVVRTGTTSAPVSLTLTGLFANRGASSVLNFTGTSLGLAGNNSRIVVPEQLTNSAFLGGWAVSGNDFAKYNAGLDGGVALGVTPLLADDYTAIADEAALVTGLTGKITAEPLAAAPITLSADRSVGALNFQTTVASTGTLFNVATNGKTLTIESGGLLQSGSQVAITGTAVGGLTAGTTAGAQLFVTANGTIINNAVILDNAGGAVTLVKSGTGTLSLVNQPGLTAGTGGVANTFTGGFVINAGTVNTSRGVYLGSGRITLAGGQLEINQPAPSSLTQSNLSGFGQNVLVTGNAFLGIDDNGNNITGQELNDASSGDFNNAPFGTLTIDGGHTLNMGGYNYDYSFSGSSMTGTPTLNIGVGRETSFASVISGAMTGSGFNLATNGTNGGAIVLGGGNFTTDNVSNAGLSSAITLYGGTLRLDKLNGVNAIGDGSASEDVVINGGTLAWGPGHFLTNSSQNSGVLRSNTTSGQDQIADTATVTMLTGALGINNQFNNEKFGTLNMKGGTLNPGLGTMEITTANISGGAISINGGSTLKTGTLNLLPGAPDVNVANTFLENFSTLEIGAGGLKMSGQTLITNPGTAGLGAVIKLGGDVTVTTDPLNGNSFQRGIFFTQGRELFRNIVDLQGGVRTFDIASDALFTINPYLVNGGITKTGAGQLVLNPYRASTFDGPVSVEQGSLTVRGSSALGSAVGGTSVSNGGTVKVEGSTILADAITLNGAGAFVPGTTILEQGALVSENGTTVLNGSLILGTDSTIATNGYQLPAGANTPLISSSLVVNAAAGITGAGTLTVSGGGTTTLVNGLNTTSGGLNKIGRGTLLVSGAGTYSGATVMSAGTLNVSHSSALGSGAAGTTVYGGATLELQNDINIASEALTLHGSGIGSLGGALNNASGVNSLGGVITLGSDATINSDSGSLTLNGALSGANRALVLSGNGNGTIAGALSLGEPSATAALTKNGPGTWTLAGANTFVGATRVNGGTLALDYRTQNGGKLDENAQLVLGGGSVSITGNAAAPTVQSVNGINLVAGGADISVAGSGGQTATFNLGSITRGAGTTANFQLGSNGVVTTSASPVNGILGGYATVNGGDWAAVNAGRITALATYSPLSANGGVGTSNSLLAVTQNQLDSVTTNSLKISGGQGLDLDFNNLTLSSGGLLSTAANFGISGSGVISGNDAETDLTVHVADGTLDIRAGVVGIGSGGLVKAGTGTLILSNTANAFSGAVTVNSGTLGIVGPGGTADALVLGGGAKDININGGTFSVVTGSYDVALNTKRLVIGSAGGTLDVADGVLLVNDAGQFSGSGTLTKTGGGRLTLNNDYSAFTGSVLVDKGILQVSNALALGGRSEQSITLGSGTALVGMGTLANNVVATGGALLGTSGGDRTFTGTLALSGTNRLVLADFDSVGTSRNMTITNRITGGGTFDVFGVGNGQAVFLTSGANEIGTMNLNANATVEVRFAGSIGNGAAPTTINMNGANSRYLLRESRDGFFNSNVVVNAQSQIDVAQLANTAVPANNATGTPNLFMTINDLTVNGSPIVTISNANTYTLRVAGASTINGSPLLNVTGLAVLENGMNFTQAGSSLNKLGGGTLTLLNGANHTGSTVVGGGTLSVRGAGGGLASTSEILIRGGTLSVENVDGANANRLNDTAPISMVGGGLRVVGTESAIGTLSVNGGSATISYTMDSQTVPKPLTLTGFNFNASTAALNFITENGTLGAVTNAQGTVNPRIIIPDQADVTGVNVLPWAVSGNEFAQYSNALDSGVARGVITVGNGSMAENSAETAWTTSIISRLTGANATTALTANRSLQAIKLDGAARGTNEVGRRIDLSGRSLSVQSGQIISVNNTMAIGNSNATTPGILTAGTAGTPARLTFTINAGTTEVGLTSTNGTGAGLTGQVVIADNGVGGAVSLFKNGGGNLQLRNTTSANTYTGGTYVNAGQLEVWRGASLGNSSNITLAGGTLHLNVPFDNGAPNQDLPGFGQNIVVNATSVLSLDNNGEVASPSGTNGVDHNANFGTLAINGPYTALTIGGFDSYDASFTSAAFAGTPTINMISRDANHTTTIGTTLLGAAQPGVVSGSGFELTGTGGTANGTLLLAGTDANTYSGPVLINGGFLRLAKPAGVTALTADADPTTFDITVNGGELRQSAANQIDDRANVQVNGGVFFLGQANNEVIASAVVNGGTIATGASTTATSQMGITGDVTVNGNSNASGGLIVDNLSTLTIGGTLTVGEYGRVGVGAGHAFSPTGTALIANNINLTGSSVVLATGGNATRLRLNGDVTTNASSLIARIDGSNDSDTYLELNGTRTFTVADGAAGEDLNVSALFINSTNPVAVGGIIKDGDGLMVISNSNGAGNTFTGPTTVNAGTLDLARNAGVNALGSGGLTIGDGLGGANADRVRLRNSNQIPDTAPLTISVSGVLDLDLANASETVASVSGGGNIVTGPNSVFGTNNPAGTSTFSGSITGAGGYTKNGVGTQVLSGVSEYVGDTMVNGGTLIVNGSISGSVTTVGASGTLGGIGTLTGPLNVDGILAPGETIGKLSSGSLTLSNTSTLSLELNGNVPGSLYDQVVVTGSVTLGGGDLSLALGYTAPFDAQFAIILNDGTDPVSGQFNGLAEGALFTTVAGVNFFITYQGNMDGGAVGNDVVLTIPEPTAALSLLTGVGMLLGMPRFRRRR